MAGSFGLNKRFEEAVKDLVGEDELFTLKKSKDFELAVQYFDRSVKTAFRGDPDEDYYVNFPLADLEDNLERNLKSSCWNINGSVAGSISVVGANYCQRGCQEDFRSTYYGY